MFLRNCWYVAGWSHHFSSDHPVARTILGEPIVLYRKADGSIAVKINGTPVSTGKSPLTSGHIGFQSEGAEIHFRNIEIKEMGK